MPKSFKVVFKVLLPVSCCTALGTTDILRKTILVQCTVDHGPIPGPCPPNSITEPPVLITFKTISKNCQTSGGEVRHGMDNNSGEELVRTRN